MAQYETNPSGEDFSDIGDVLGNLDYANLNNDDPTETPFSTPPDNMVPLTFEIQSPKEPKQKTGGKTKTPTLKKNQEASGKSHVEMDQEELDEDSANEALHDLCDEVGIVMTKQMENQVHRLCKVEPVTKTSLRWFVRGYTNCLGSHILSSLKENMTDMRTEVKRLQSGSAVITRGVDALTAASGQLLSRIDEAKDDIRDRFHSSLENVESAVADTLEKVKKMAESESFRHNQETLASQTVTITPKLSPSDVKGRVVEKVEISVPDVVKPPSFIGQHSKESVADSESPAKIRRSLMSRVGFTAAFSANLPESVLMEAIPPSLLTELKGAAFSPRIKAAVKKVILDNIKKTAGQE